MIGALVSFEPSSVYCFGTVVGVGSVEKDDAVLPRAVGEQPQKIILSAAGFGEDDRFPLRAKFGGLVHSDAKSFEQCIAFGVVIYRCSEAGEVFEIGDLRLNRVTISFGKWGLRFVVVPFFRGFLQRSI